MMNLTIHGTPVCLRRPHPTVDDDTAYDATALGISLGESMRDGFVRVFVVYRVSGYVRHRIHSIPLTDLVLDVGAATELRDCLTEALDDGAP